MKPEIAVVGRTPKGLDDVRLTSRSNRRRLDLKPLEIAALEALRVFPRFSEIDLPRALARLRELDSDGKIDLRRVGWAAKTERRPTVTAALEAMTK